MYTNPRTWVTAETVTATQLNTHVRDNFDAVIPTGSVAATAWTPVLNGPTQNSTVTGRRWRVGPLQYLWARAVIPAFIGSDAIWFYDLPLAAVGISTGTVIGSWFATDASASSNNEVGSCFLAGNDVQFAAAGGTVTGNHPFGFSVDDTIACHIVYPVA